MKRTKSSLIAPCHFDYDVADIIFHENGMHDDLLVTELYGAVSNEIIRHGRSREAVKNITREEAVKFKNYLSAKDIGFIYLLNAPFNFDNTKDIKIKVDEYLDWVVNELKPEAVTISSHDLAKFVRSRYGSLKIYVSTIAAVSNIEQYDNFMDVEPSRIVLQYDTNRNWFQLESLAKHTQSVGVEIELMLNESCIRDCANRQAHYAALGATKEGWDARFLTSCNSRKLIYPYELLKSNYIRPEDIRMYEDIGVNKFKITGRSKKAEWLPKVIEAYQDRRFKGNLMRILGVDPSINAEEWIYINNSALEGFLEGFVNNDEDKYAEEWIQKLYNNGDFYVNDGTEYKVDDAGFLAIKNLGIRAGEIIRNEQKR